jgi:exopolysaccharide biosynthesis WecB/TagA/CpsF family protein
MLNWMSRKVGSSYLKGGINTFLNPYSYMLIRKEGAGFEAIDRVMIDGQLLVVILRLFGWNDLIRKSFDMTSLAPEVFKEAERAEDSVCFVGSKQVEITEAINVISKEFPRLNVIRYRNGYFDSDEWSKEIDLLVKLNPSVVVTGLGTPLQEQFLLDLRKNGWHGTGFTCGGFFHQTASGIEYYPEWIDKYNLRWVYRIYDEPKLFSRYFWDYPKAIVYIVWDLKIKPCFT